MLIKWIICFKEEFKSSIKIFFICDVLKNVNFCDVAENLEQYKEIFCVKDMLKEYNIDEDVYGILNKNNKNVIVKYVDTYKILDENTKCDYCLLTIPFSFNLFEKLFKTYRTESCINFERVEIFEIIQKSVLMFLIDKL